MLLFLCKDLSLCSSSPGHIRVVRCTSQIHNTVHVGHIHEGDAHKRTQSLDTGGRGRSISASFRTFGPMSVVFPWTWTEHSSTLHACRFHGVGVSNCHLAFHPDGSFRSFFPWLDDPTQQAWSVGFVRPLRSYFMGGFLSPSARNRSASFPERGMFFNHRTAPFHRHTAVVRSVHAPLRSAAIVLMSVERQSEDVGSFVLFFPFRLRSLLLSSGFNSPC